MRKLFDRTIVILVAASMTQVALADAPGRVRRWDVTPTALVAGGEPALQNIDLAIDAAEAIQACTLKVWADGRLLAEKALGSMKPGPNQVSVLLPEPSSTLQSRWALYDGDAALAETALTWKPPRHWTIYEVLSAHTDMRNPGKTLFQEWKACHDQETTVAGPP
jgi:hypothetical protein